MFLLPTPAAGPPSLRDASRHRSCFQYRLRTPGRGRGDCSYIISVPIDHRKWPTLLFPCQPPIAIGFRCPISSWSSCRTPAGCSPQTDGALVRSDLPFGGSMFAKTIATEENAASVGKSPKRQTTEFGLCVLRRLPNESGGTDTRTKDADSRSRSENRAPAEKSVSSRPTGDKGSD